MGPVAAMDNVTGSNVSNSTSWYVNSNQTIQSVVDNASSGDTIIVEPGVYNENVVLNKSNLSVESEGNVTVCAFDPSQPCFYVGSDGNNDLIEGFTITGSQNAGIYISHVYTCLILGNTISRNNNGIYLDSSSNITIIKNNIINNINTGVYIYNSSAILNFNRIVGNNFYGIYLDGNGVVDATDNWWGSNNGPNVSDTNSSSIYLVNGTAIYNPWIVLTLNSPFNNLDHNASINIMADLTHNNNGNDTSPLGNLPDNLSLYYNTTLGTINNTSSTRNGKAITVLTNNEMPGIANISVTLDNQTTSKTIELYGVYNTRTQQGFNSIQDAINSANTQNGDTLTIGEGNYTENIIINKTLTLTSNKNTTIQTSNPNNPIITITNTGTGSTIQGLKITGATHSSGIYINSANNCTITENTITNSNYGINANSNNAIITNDTITNITSDGLVVYGSNAVITGLNVYNVSGTGIRLNDNGYGHATYSNATLTDNNVSGNGNGIIIYNTNVSMITGNTATGEKGTGIYASGDGSTVSRNTVTGNKGTGLEVHGNNVIITNDNVIHDEGGDGLVVYGNNVLINGFTVYNVSGTGIRLNDNGYGHATYSNATLTDNNVSGNGNGIIIYNTNGVTLSRNVATGEKSVGIYVNGNNAIITGDNVIHDNNGTGLWVSGNNIVLSGFDVYNNGGSGIVVTGSSPTVTGNTVAGNGGTGIVVQAGTGVSSGALVSNNIAAGNGGSGVSVSGDATVTSNNVIYGNNGDGLDVSGYGTYILNNIISINGGSGLSVTGDYATISGNNVTSNVRDGISVRGTNAHLTGNIIINNGGNGISVNGASASITGNTIGGNNGNGISVNGDSATITGNTVLYNVGSGIIVNGANSNVTGNNVNYNGNIGIRVNGVDGTGNGTYNGLRVSGPVLLGLLSKYGDISLGEGVQATVDSVLAAADGVIDAFVTDFAAIELNVGTKGGVVGLAIVLSLVGLYLTVKYPNEYPQTIYTLENTLTCPVLTPLTIYILQSELHGDGNPLTPDKLQIDFQKSVIVLQLLYENNKEDIYDALSSSNYPQIFENAVKLAEQNSGDVDAGGGSPDPRLLKFFEACRDLIDNGWNKLKSLDIKGGTVDILMGTGGTILAGVFWPVYEVIEALDSN
jgi:parallel beta-helix repeat protein